MVVFICIYIFLCVYVFIYLCGIYQVILQPFRCWERLYVSECDVYRRQDHRTILQAPPSSL